MSRRNLSDISQEQWLKACLKLGLLVDKKSGKGSHAKIKNSKTGGTYTIQHSLYRISNIKIFKKLQSWGLSEDEIWNAL